MRHVIAQFSCWGSLKKSRQDDEVTVLLFLPCVGRKLRCVGSALSPNGLAFEEEGMVSLALMGEVLGVDPVRRQVVPDKFPCICPPCIAGG